MSRAWAVGFAAAAAVLLVWAITGGGGVTAKLKLKLTGDTNADAPVMRWGPIRTGTSPDAYGHPCTNVPGAVLGRHPLYRHAPRMSPRMSVAMHPDAYDWLFCPPSEVDL